MLCKLAYPKTFDHASLGFIDDGHRAIYNRHGSAMARVLSKAKKKEVIVVFRGTQSFRDWLLNLCFFPIRATASEPGEKSPCGYVHFGYQYLLNQRSVPSNGGQSTLHDGLKQRDNSVYAEIQRCLLPHIKSGKRVTFTGHSSGGAMAILAAQRLELAYPRSVRRVVTFGQPATSFGKFYRCYLLHKRTFRVCCDLDIVTFLPPLPGLFKHVGRSLWLHDERIYENAHPAWRLYRVVTRWFLSPISYHYMHKYIRDKDFFDEH